MEGMKDFFKNWIVPIAIALILSLLIRKYIFFNIKVPSESMYPTIKAGDRILVTRLYNMDKLERGDILVFQSKELGNDLIKRLIGLPGQTVEVKEDGSVFIDSKKIEEPYVIYNIEKERFVTLNNTSFKIPENCYVFFGDNRANSRDSRYWNEPYINEADIKGKAQIIIFPFSRFGKLQ